MNAYVANRITMLGFSVIIVAFLSLRSDKLRWISALSRPHPKIDFSAAQGEEVDTN